MTRSVNSTFKCEEENKKSHIFTIYFIIFIVLEKNRCMLGIRCFTLTIKLELRQVINRFFEDKIFTNGSIRKPPWEYWGRAI